MTSKPQLFARHFQEESPNNWSRPRLKHYQNNGLTIVPNLDTSVQPILCVNPGYIVRNGQIRIITSPKYMEYSFNSNYNSELILMTKSWGLSKLLIRIITITLITPICNRRVVHFDQVNYNITPSWSLSKGNSSRWVTMLKWWQGKPISPICWK